MRSRPKDLLFFILIILCAPFFTGSAFALGGGLTVELTAPDLQGSPGEVLTLPFRIINESEEVKTLKAEADLPSNWRMLTPPGKFILHPGESTVRLLNLYIPRGMRAEFYPIRYRVQDQVKKEIVTEKEVAIEVSSYFELDIVTLQVPDMVFAGDDYTVDFQVANLSNDDLTVTFNLTSQPDYHLALSQNTLVLSPGESELIQVEIETDGETIRRISHRLTLLAEGWIEDDVMISSSARISVDVIPRISGIDDPYHYLPVRVGGTFSYQNNFDLKFELAARGSLDEEETQWLDLFIRPPSIKITKDDIIFGNEIYRFSYWDEVSQINVGDHRFSLSELTEWRIRARGVEARTLLEGLEVGAYYRQREDEKEGWAFYMHYPHDEDVLFTLGYLDRESGDFKEQMYALGSEIRLEGNHNIELEYAKGVGEDDGQAYRGESSGRIEDLSYRADYLLSDPEFPGRISDRESYNLRLGYRFVPEFSMHTAYGVRKDNLTYDPDADARERTVGELGATYRWEDTRFYFTHRQIWDLDRHLVPAFEEKEDSWRLGVRQSYTGGSLNAYYERAWINDLLTSEEGKIDRLRARATYRPETEIPQRYGIHYRLDSDEERTRHWGSLNATYDLEEDYRLNFRFARRYDEGEADDQKFIGDRLSATLAHFLEEGGRFDLGYTRLQHANTRDEFSAAYTGPAGDGTWKIEGLYTLRDDGDDDFSFKIELAQNIHFGIPVSRRQVGRLTGRIYDEANRDLKNVIVRVNGVTAVTDEDGYYVFPDLIPGDYHLEVDSGTLERGLVVDASMPLSFSIEAEEEKAIDVSVVRGSTIEGQAVVYVPEQENNMLSNNNDIELVPGEGLANIQLVLRSENGDVYVRHTDSSGRFRFPNLRTGRWELTVNDRGNLPAHHDLEQSTFTFDLEPGTSEEVEIRILPRERIFEFIDFGDL